MARGLFRPQVALQPSSHVAVAELRVVGTQQRAEPRQLLGPQLPRKQQGPWIAHLLGQFWAR
eukprot:3713941-Lingulodinium_polyedra.AAC.1